LPAALAGTGSFFYRIKDIDTSYTGPSFPARHLRSQGPKTAADATRLTLHSWPVRGQIDGFASAGRVSNTASPPRCALATGSTPFWERSVDFLENFGAHWPVRGFSRFQQDRGCCFLSINVSRAQIQC
jgi:hypothetical protein